mmetsp:Transcript_1491/g.2072  ORF Transcript_1491/g.2072 Transcript_1491/m.2072 type:complete len:387 (+) Transcript_1491:68-1228(+)
MAKDAALDPRSDSNRDHANDRGAVEDDFVRPFEWLTSPESLQPLLQSVFANDENQSAAASYRVLHVGSGSSVWGEYVLEHETELFPTCKGGGRISQVVNLDKDEETLATMQARWQKLCERHQQTCDVCHPSSSSFCGIGNQFEKLEFCVNDLANERMPFANDSFDVILDKSTLDCTLCSDTATAWLLHEVHRLLQPCGGAYVLISFHHFELLLPLLQNCPGADWTVTHSTMERHVEDLVSPNKKQDRNIAKQSKLESQDGEQEDRKPLQVLVARRKGSGQSTLDMDKIYHHIHETNDNWYKTQHPILTPERCQDIRQSFGKDGPSLSLQKCYIVLFTDAEKEQLSFDYFLEDWNAFLQPRQAESAHALSSDSMTLDIALTFLEEMQ